MFHNSILNSYVTTFFIMLWQPLDQCPIAALQVNLKGRYLVGNMSCVIHKRTQQGTTTIKITRSGLCFFLFSFSFSFSF